MLYSPRPPQNKKIKKKNNKKTYFKEHTNQETEVLTLYGIHLLGLEKVDDDCYSKLFL